jgi:hypothetical protein
MTKPPVPFVLTDHRLPGVPMAGLPVKIPADALPRLQAMADHLRCNRGALARALVLQGLEQLEEATTAAQGVR